MMTPLINKSPSTRPVHIGICDSGLGGLSILSPIARSLPCAHFSYVADDAYAPYGPLDKETLIERASAVCDLLLARGCDLIVVACNTLTAHAIDEMRQRYQVPFVGVEPYVNALNKGLGADARPAILCTVSTSKSSRFLNLVQKCDPTGRSLVWPCPTLAKSIEGAYQRKLEGRLDQGEQVLASLQADLESLKEHAITHVILGCTHYPLVRAEIESFLSVQSLSPCEHVARRVVDLTKESYVTSEIEVRQYDFYSTKTSQWIIRPLSDAKQLR